jgi:hypothetical protein
VNAGFKTSYLDNVLKPHVDEIFWEDRHILEFLIIYLLMSIYLLEGQEINKIDDEIKIHSLIHNQLSALIFNGMIRYAWFASKL